MRRRAPEQPLRNRQGFLNMHGSGLSAVSVYAVRKTQPLRFRARNIPGNLRHFRPNTIAGLRPKLQAIGAAPTVKCRKIVLTQQLRQGLRKIPTNLLGQTFLDVWGIDTVEL